VTEVPLAKRVEQASKLSRALGQIGTNASESGQPALAVDRLRRARSWLF
jgi:hypothetical protein